MIEKISLKDQACAQIRDMILSGELGLGDYLNVSELSRMFGISNSPIREAISSLENEGLVVTKPNMGAFVIDFDRKNFIELDKMIEVLQSGCYELCVHSGKTDDLIALLEERLAEQEKNYTDDVTYEYACCAIDFDRAFVDVCENDMLSKMFDSKFNLLALHTMFVYAKDPGANSLNLQEHRDILKTIKDGHDAEVLDLIDRHYDKSAYIRYLSE